MLTVDLHPYQDSAVDHFLERGSLLLAYEMGLGKTVCALAASEDLLGRGEIETCVIVVPANLKYQWAQQLAKLTDLPTHQVTVRSDGIKQEITIPAPSHCVIVDGAREKRHDLLRYAIEHRPEYVLLTYESVVNDWDLVKKIHPDMIVLDEATAIKSFAAQRTRKIKRLTAPYRLALTGTPVENGKPEELFSIMQWVDDGVLGRWDLFDKAYVVRNGFGAVTRYKNLPVLHAKLAQAMQRKTRRDPEVAPYLPQVAETDVLVDMDAPTRKVYDVIAADLLAELRNAKVKSSFDLAAYYAGKDGGDKSEQGKIMSRMMAMDMLLASPVVLAASARRYLDSAGEDGGAYPATLWEAGLLADGVLNDSPKLVSLVEQVDRILEFNPENKIIVFSVWRDAVDLISTALAEHGVVQFHGGMNAVQKAAAVAQFTHDPGTHVFVSSHAGAYGTDLFCANYLINYDQAWQAGKQDQINARHVRASSEWDHVYVLNLITKNSVEVRRAQTLAFKRQVGSSIVDNTGADEHGRVENEVASLTSWLEAA